MQASKCTNLRAVMPLELHFKHFGTHFLACLGVLNFFLETETSLELMQSEC